MSRKRLFTTDFLHYALHGLLLCSLLRRQHPAAHLLQTNTKFQLKHCTADCSFCCSAADDLADALSQLGYSTAGTAGTAWGIKVGVDCC